MKNDIFKGVVCKICGNDAYYEDGNCTKCENSNIEATGYIRINCEQCQAETFINIDGHPVCLNCGEDNCLKYYLATKKEWEKFFGLNEEDEEEKICINKAKIINLTPHQINIIDKETSKEILVIQSSDTCRCKEEIKTIGSIDGIEIISKSFGEVEGLPKVEDTNVIYIVSLPIAQAVKGKRFDCFIPGEIVRDKEGKIIGCYNLAKV
jgi:hypothetical protein